LLTIIELSIEQNNTITPQSFVDAWQSKYKNTFNIQSDDFDMDRLSNLNVLNKTNENDDDNNNDN